ncbi:MAG: polysaccharide deacetylase [Lachnospiraceae bacterium]|nr:polysaccharide deacetylase [Lachnospiraceae bacterium]
MTETKEEKTEKAAAVQEPEQKAETITEKLRHKKRIRRMKHAIVGFVVLLCVLPTVLSIVALAQIRRLDRQLTLSRQVIEDLYGRVGEARRLAEESMAQTENVEITPNAAQPQDARDTSVVEKDPYEDMVKICLTFDDGPSRYTDTILDILASYDVKATFFVNGHPGYEDQYRRIVAEGHTLGMHSYSHEYSSVYADLDGFADDLFQIQTYLKEVTGEDSIFYRFPGGSSNTVHKVDMQSCIRYLDAKGITYFDWNVSGGDALGYTRSVNAIVDSVISQINALDTDTIVILLHDAPGKETTVEALPILIEKLQAMEGSVLVPIDEDTKPVQHVLPEED